MSDSTVFLLSPAYCGGRRAQALLRPDSESELAVRLRGGELTLGEAFAFISGLYFRGKLAYARRFGSAPAPVDPVLVITSDRGLLPASALVSRGDLTRFAEVPIDAADRRYAEPMEAALESLAERFPAGRLVLLGSIATSKYVEMLLDVFGERLCFPEMFVGMGDMQRGSVLLRAAERGEPLACIPAMGARRSTAGRTRRGAATTGGTQ